MTPATPPQPVLSFRLPIGRHRGCRYYNVLIFATKDAMYEFVRTDDSRKFARRVGRTGGDVYNFEALTRRFDVLKLDRRPRQAGTPGHRTCVPIARRPRRWRRLPSLGQILFHQGQLGSGIVAHEAAHAALYSFDGWRTRPTNGLDEGLAWRIGWLVNQFWRAYYRRVPHAEPKPLKR